MIHDLRLFLSKTTIQDLEALFLFQTDEVSIHMAAFMSGNPHDKEAYMEKWSKIVETPAINMQTIWLDEEIVGSVAHFDLFDETNVTYWIDRKHWGKGIASQALKGFIDSTDKRPLVGRTAFDNIGSQKVLEKCGFRQIRKEQGFANARNMEIEEFVYLLD